MGLLDAILLRLILWLCLPLVLVILAVGPWRIGRWLKQSWHWIRERRQDPAEILEEVVRQHGEHIGGLRKALGQAETAETEIVRNIQKSEANMPALEEEARRLASHGDDLGARAALYKLNLERAAIASFKEQLESQRQHITESRRRLYRLELQLRQFEVGRSILLGQLAEAKTVEQQYAIAKHFDPFQAVASWEKAEDLVQEKAITARAAERVHADTTEVVAGPSPVDSGVLEVQLEELKARLQLTNSATKRSAEPVKSHGGQAPNGPSDDMQARNLRDS
jgi:phage shock protein A